MNRKRNLPEGISVLSLRLPTAQLEELRAVAAANTRTLSQEARRALALHVESEKGAAA